MPCSAGGGASFSGSRLPKVLRDRSRRQQVLFPVRYVAECVHAVRRRLAIRGTVLRPVRQSGVLSGTEQPCATSRLDLNFPEISHGYRSPAQEPRRSSAGDHGGMTDRLCCRLDGVKRSALTPKILSHHPPPRPSLRSSRGAAAPARASCAPRWQPPTARHRQLSCAPCRWLRHECEGAC